MEKLDNKINFKRKLSEQEQELADRNEELEAQHEELTAAVEALINKNDHLEKTLQELKLRNKEIDQIVYRSSHDLKTPITAIEGLLSLMEVDPSNMPEYLDRSINAIDDMKELLKMLSRYSSNLVTDVNIDTIDFNILLDEIRDEMKKVSGFNEVKCNVDCTSEVINSDRERVHLILYTLIKNAIDFRGANPRIDVSIKKRINQLRIQIADNGKGISHEIQDSVFDMFYRGDNESKGSGLGLYLCKRAVEMIGGKINLVSTEGIGTTVTVDIPI